MGKLSGIVAEWCAREYGGRFESVDLSTTVGTSAAVVAKNNNERVNLLFINTSVNTINIKMGSAPTTSTGITLAPNGGSCALNLLEDLTLPAMQWFAIASGAGSELTVYGVQRYAAITEGDL